MSRYCSAHDDWLIMKLCMYVGYHDANNVSNFGGGPLSQLNFKNVLKIEFAILYSKICAVLDIMRKLLEEHILVMTK